jgi:hypothetical protein
LELAGIEYRQLFQCLSSPEMGHSNPRFAILAAGMAILDPRGESLNTRFIILNYGGAGGIRTPVLLLWLPRWGIRTHVLQFAAGMAL